MKKELGILVSKDLKWGNQVYKAIKSANSVIAQIKNSFTYFDAELVKLLYVSLVRPHLLICSLDMEPLFAQRYRKIRVCLT